MEKIKEKIEERVSTLNEKKKNIKKEVKERTLEYILAALGLAAGLSWNDAIKSLIEYLFPLNKNSLLAKFIYSLFVTIFIVLLSLYITKILEKNKSE